jgi:signal transduction histidine kinase/CheY-like chemotaxis protein/HPt (histidine-containing phosphotransfer) domain-containing protein
MMVLLIMQFKSNQSINDLQKSNQQAARTFQLNNKIEDIINYNYEVENIIRKFLISKKNDPALYIPKIIDSINMGVAKIKELASDGNNQAIVENLSALINKEAVFYKRVFDTSYRDNNAAKALLISEEAKQLTDNIYEAATRIQLELEKDLQGTIIESTGVSKKVQYLSQWLIFIAVGAIIILGTIIIRDLRRNLRLIQDLEVANDKTHKAALIKEQFLANMSHEIRTPINSVIGFTQLLQKTNLTTEQKQFVSLINTSGNYLLNIINDILDISKLEANMLQLEKNPFSVQELCYTLEMMFTHQAKEKGLFYTSRVSENVPEILLGDKERLNQVLVNLIANAFKFTHSGEVTLSVEKVSQSLKNATLRFIVKDTGIGIAASKLDSIFERFEQADADTTRKYGGTGLGLAIVKNIITMHGGFIKVKSEPGEGSAFTFEIPFELNSPQAENTSDMTNEVSSSVTTIRKNLTGINILAAEDNKMNQTLLKFLFKQWEANYTLVETGEQAITKLKENNFDLLLLDIQMPVMDGYTAARLIRTDIQSNIPIIAMTAHVLPGEKERCLSNGMNDYISKPLNEKDLFTLLQKYISGSNFIQKPGSDTFQFLNIPYLTQTYSDNQSFIAEVLNQFKEQYPLELTELEEAVKARDTGKIRKLAHHMKTTVTAINNSSPLYKHCERIEKIEPVGINSWKNLEKELWGLTSSKETVLEEINIVLERNITDLAVK